MKMTLLQFSVWKRCNEYEFDLFTSFPNVVGNQAINFHFNLLVLRGRLGLDTMN